jgi:hypothetical protein
MTPTQSDRLHFSELNLRPEIPVSFQHYHPFLEASRLLRAWASNPGSSALQYFHLRALVQLLIQRGTNLVGFGLL